jgi:hypothetical protein
VPGAGVIGVIVNPAYVTENAAGVIGFILSPAFFADLSLDIGISDIFHGKYSNWLNTNYTNVLDPERRRSEG